MLYLNILINTLNNYNNTLFIIEVVKDMHTPRSFMSKTCVFYLINFIFNKYICIL